MELGMKDKIFRKKIEIKNMKRMKGRRGIERVGIKEIEKIMESLKRIDKRRSEIRVGRKINKKRMKKRWEKVEMKRKKRKEREIGKKIIGNIEIEI